MSHSITCVRTPEESLKCMLLGFIGQIPRVLEIFIFLLIHIRLFFFRLNQTANYFHVGPTEIVRWKTWSNFPAPFSFYCLYTTTLNCQVQDSSQMTRYLILMLLLQTTNQLHKGINVYSLKQHYNYRVKLHHTNNKFLKTSS